MGYRFLKCESKFDSESSIWRKCKSRLYGLERCNRTSRSIDRSRLHCTIVVGIANGIDKCKSSWQEFVRRRPSNGRCGNISIDISNQCIGRTNLYGYIPRQGRSGIEKRDSEEGWIGNGTGGTRNWRLYILWLEQFIWKCDCRRNHYCSVHRKRQGRLYGIKQCNCTGRSIERRWIYCWIVVGTANSIDKCEGSWQELVCRRPSNSWCSNISVDICSQRVGRTNLYGYIPWQGWKYLERTNR